jgi:hypothetical protein
MATMDDPARLFIAAIAAVIIFSVAFTLLRGK